MVVTRDTQSPSTWIAGQEMNNFYYANVVKEKREFAFFFSFIKYSGVVCLHLKRIQMRKGYACQFFIYGNKLHVKHILMCVKITILECHLSTTNNSMCIWILWMFFTIFFFEIYEELIRKDILPLLQPYKVDGQAGL